MCPKNWLDWSDFKGQVKQPEHPFSKPLDPSLKKGADVAKEALTTGQLPVMGAPPPPQPTNEQMFGHLVVSEEMVKKADAQWNNLIGDTLTEARKPIDHLNKTKIDAKWGYGKSFNSLLKGQLTAEEIAQRNADTKER